MKMHDEQNTKVYIKTGSATMLYQANVESEEKEKSQ